MASFNIKQLLSGASLQTEQGAEAGAAQELQRRQPLKVVPLNIRDLIPSEDNFYFVENIAELKSSIEMFGVLQNLTVKPLEGGKYKIIAGHRRHKACTELVAEGKTEYEYIPCGIQTEPDEIKERILLIMTNSTARELSDWEKMKQAEELRKYFEILKKRDNLTGRVRDLVAEALGTSATQIARMTAIEKNLTPELMEEFKEGRLGLSAAYELSGMNAEQQQEAHVEYQQKGGLSINEVREKKQEATPPADKSESYTQNQPQEMRDRFMESMGRDSTPPVPPTTTAQIVRPEPRDYPETPPDFEEGQRDEPDAPESQDFADMSAEEKTDVAVAMLNRKRFALFAPGEDTRPLDFIIEILECYAEEKRAENEL